MENQIILQGMRKEDLIEGVADEVFRKIAKYLKEINAPERIMDRKEAAAYLNIALRTLDELTKNGKIKYSKIESAVRFKQSELDAYVTRNEVRIKKFS
jgi:excisionase family DNA binding protein